MYAHTGRKRPNHFDRILQARAVGKIVGRVMLIRV